MNPSPIYDLPPEILAHIFSFLSIKETSDITTVCKTFSHIAHYYTRFREKGIELKVFKILHVLGSEDLSEREKNRRVSHLINGIKKLGPHIRHLNLDLSPYFRIDKTNNVALLKLIQKVNLSEISSLIFPLFPNLESLDLNFWRWLQGEGLSPLKKCNFLTSLTLDTCFISRDYWQDLKSLKQIEHLSIEHRSCGYIMDPSIAEMTQLKNLEIPQCDITDKDMISIGHLTNLEQLNLKKNNRWVANGFSIDLTASGISNLKNLTFLTKLNVNNCFLNRESLAIITTLEKLRYLNISRNSCFLENRDIESLTALCRLETLRMDFCKMPAEMSLKPIGHLKKLRTFSAKTTPSYTTSFEDYSFVMELNRLQKLTLGHPYTVASFSFCEKEDVEKCLTTIKAKKYWDDYLAISSHPTLKTITIEGFGLNLKRRNWEELLKKVLLSEFHF